MKWYDDTNCGYKMCTKMDRDSIFCSRECLKKKYISGLNFEGIYRCMKIQAYLTISVKKHHSCAIKTADDSQNGYIGIDWCESTEIYEASDSTIGLKNYTINFNGRGQVYK